jgi:hypothetical protein
MCSVRSARWPWVQSFSRPTGSGCTHPHIRLIRYRVDHSLGVELGGHLPGCLAGRCEALAESITASSSPNFRGDHPALGMQPLQGWPPHAGAETKLLARCGRLLRAVSSRTRRGLPNAVTDISSGPSTFRAGAGM